jgi:hypothetical protein
LNAGDRIRFDFENAPELFGIIPEERDVDEKHGVEGSYLFCVYTRSFFFSPCICA